MGAGKFLSANVAKAARLKATLGDGLGGALGASAPIVAHLFPSLDAMITPNLWLIPVFGVAGAALVRLVSAPYLVWRDTSRELEDLKTRLSSPDILIKEKMALKRTVWYDEFADLISTMCICLHSNEIPDIHKARRFGELSFSLAFDTGLDNLVSAFRAYLVAHDVENAQKVGQKMLDHIRTIGT